MNIDLALAEQLAAAQQPPQRGSTLREFLTICFRDRSRIGMAFLVPFAATVALSFVPSPRYTSDASLLVRLGREYVYRPEVGDAGNAAPMAYDSRETLRAEVEILNSRDIKEGVLKTLGLEAVYPWLANAADEQKRLNAALAEFQARFEARLLKDSNVIQLAYTHKDPEVAARVLNKAIEVYLDRRRGIFASADQSSAQAKVDALSTRLNQAEEALANFKLKQGILSFSEQQTLLLGRQHTLEMKLDESVLALAQSAGRSRSLQASMDFVGREVTLSRETQRSEAVEAARKTLLDLQLKELDLAAKFSDDTPAVVDVRAAIARTEAFIARANAQPQSTVRSGRSPARDAVETDLLRSRADQRHSGAGMDVLQKQRRVLDDKLKNLAGSQRQLQNLERERRLLEVSYEAAVRRLEESRVQDELDRSRKSNVSIVQAARVPFQAKSLQGVILGVGTLLSVCFALMVAFFTALWRDTFLTPEQVQRTLGLPLLTSVPKADQ